VLIQRLLRKVGWPNQVKLTHLNLTHSWDHERYTGRPNHVFLPDQLIADAIQILVRSDVEVTLWDCHRRRACLAECLQGLCR